MNSRVRSDARRSACLNLMESIHDGRKVRSLLEETDGSDASGAGGKTRGCIIEGNAADGEYRDRNRAADFSEAVEALRGAVGGF